jgi:hypothetical protein
MKPDSFRWLPIVLVSFALTISCLSWWESRRNRVVNEVVNRPVLSLGIPNLTQITFRKNPVRGLFLVPLKNSGKTTALIAETKTEFVSLPGDQCTPRIISNENSLERDREREILPSMEGSIYMITELDSSLCKHFDKGLFLEVSYSDAGSGAQYAQRLTTRLVLELKDSPIPQKSNLPKN